MFNRLLFSLSTLLLSLYGVSFAVEEPHENQVKEVAVECPELFTPDEEGTEVEEDDEEEDTEVPEEGEFGGEGAPAGR